MSPTALAIFDDVADVLSAVTGLPAAGLSPELSLQDDLHLDSLSYVDLLMTAEEHFGIAIPDSLANARTAGEAAEQIADLLAQSG